jgi:MOSC domain-containing protein YiiM
MLREGFGLVGDGHAGTERQVSLLAQESIDAFVGQELSSCPTTRPLGPGDFAENLTTSGLCLHALPVGTQLQVGASALLEITQIGKACHADCEIKRATGRCVMPTEGVFARVLVGGEVRPGDEVVVVSRGEAREAEHAASDCDGE